MSDLNPLKIVNPPSEVENLNQPSLEEGNLEVEKSSISTPLANPATLPNAPTSSPDESLEANNLPDVQKIEEVMPENIVPVVESIQNTLPDPVTKNEMKEQENTGAKIVEAQYNNYSSPYQAINDLNNFLKEGKPSSSE